MVVGSGSTNSEPGAIATGFNVRTDNWFGIKRLQPANFLKDHPVAIAPGSEFVDTRRDLSPFVLSPQQRMFQLFLETQRLWQRGD